MTTDPAPSLQYTDFDWDNARQIGMGAMAKVYVVEYTPDKVEYAVKAVSKSMLVHEGKVEAVFNEKAVLTKMKGEREVCQALGTFQTDEEIFFVVEYFPKGNLEMLSINGPLPTPLIASVTAQIVAGLEKIHRAGFVHRDVKLENVCVREDGSVALIDFDTVLPCADLPVSNDKVTKSIHEQSREDKQRRWTISEIKDIRRKTQMFAGTAQYISPEMLDSCVWSFASDLWALGCTVFQLGSGVSAFAGGSQFEVFRKIVKGKIDFNLIGDPTIADFCSKLLVLNPANRLGAEHGPSSDQFLESLKGHRLFTANGITWDNAWDHSLMLDVSPKEDAEYIEKMVGSSPTDSFDDWIAKKTAPPAGYVPPADLDVTYKPREEASDEDDCMNVEDIGVAQYQPFTFGEPGSP